MVVSIDSVSLNVKGPSLTLTLDAGQTLGVYGPAASGKSTICRVLAGLERAKRGSVRVPKSVAFAEARSVGRRGTPLGVAQQYAGPGGASRVAGALSAVKLWDKRKEPLSNLSPGELAGVDLLPALAGHARLIVIDGLLDAMDLWMLESVTLSLETRLREGSAMILSTNRPEFARRLDTLVVMNHRSIVFAGGLTDLERRAPSTTIEVETQRQPGVRALVEPFQVSIRKLDDGRLEIQSNEGQKLAAKLLTEGYGDVKTLVTRRLSNEELLRSLIA